MRTVRERKLEHYARAYGQGQLTLARAAEAAGVTLWEMTSYVQANRVPAQYDESDLRADLSRMKTRGPRSRRR